MPTVTNNNRGFKNIETGSVTGDGVNTQYTVTFATERPNTEYDIILTPVGDAGGDLTAYVRNSSKTTTGMIIFGISRGSNALPLTDTIKWMVADA